MIRIKYILVTFALLSFAAGTHAQSKKRVDTTSNVSILPDSGKGKYIVSYALKINNNVRISVLDGAGKLVYDSTVAHSPGRYTEKVYLENPSPGLATFRIQSNEWICVKHLLLTGK